MKNRYSITVAVLYLKQLYFKHNKLR